MRSVRYSILSTAYPVVGFFILVGLFALGAALARSLGAWLGFDPLLPQIVLAAAMALCIRPAHRFIRRGLDQRIGRAGCSEALPELLRPLQRQDRDGAVIELARRLDTLVAEGAAYVRSEEGFVRIRGRIARGGADGSIPIATLEDILGAVARKPAAVVVLPASPSAGDADPMQPLRRLGAALLLPVSQGERLEAALLLGPPRSGAGYEEGDVFALGAAAAHLSSHLERLAQQQLSKPVFLGFAAEDRESAEEICRLLEEHGIDVWMSPRDVDAQRDAAEQVVEAIERAGAVVIVISGSANASEAVRNQAVLARTSRRPTILFAIENVNPSPSLLFYTAAQQRLHAWQPPLRPHVERLAQAIAGLQAGPAEGPAPERPRAVR